MRFRFQHLLCEILARRAAAKPGDSEREVLKLGDAEVLPPRLARQTSSKRRKQQASATTLSEIQDSGVVKKDDDKIHTPLVRLVIVLVVRVRGRLGKLQLRKMNTLAYNLNG